MKKLLIGGIFLTIAISFGVYRYIYQDHRDIATEKADFTLTVPKMYDEFLSDEEKANAQYLNKTIAIEGKITAVDPSDNSIVVDEKLWGILLDSTKVPLNIGSEIHLKGRFLGYDDLLEQLKFDQVTIK